VLRAALRQGGPIPGPGALASSGLSAISPYSAMYASHGAPFWPEPSAGAAGVWDNPTPTESHPADPGAEHVPRAVAALTACRRSHPCTPYNRGAGPQRAHRWFRSCRVQRGTGSLTPHPRSTALLACFQSLGLGVETRAFRRFLDRASGPAGVMPPIRRHGGIAAHEHFRAVNQAPTVADAAVSAGRPTPLLARARGPAPTGGRPVSALVVGRDCGAGASLRPGAVPRSPAASALYLRSAHLFAVHALRTACRPFPQSSAVVAPGARVPPVSPPAWILPART